MKDVKTILRNCGILHGDTYVFENEVFQSKIVNCYVQPRVDQKGVMFWAKTNGDILASLDGYAVIPIEEYNKLKKQNERPPKNPPPQNKPIGTQKTNPVNQRTG